MNGYIRDNIFEDEWELDETPLRSSGINLLPISMRIAARTIGLDLVSVVPMSSPRIELIFVDFAYNGKHEEKKNEVPKGQIFSEYDPYGEEIWDE